MESETKRTVRRLDLIRAVLILTLILYIAVSLIMNSSYLTLDRMMRLWTDVVSSLKSPSEAGEVLSLRSEDVLDLQLFQDGYAVLRRNGVSVCSTNGSVYSSHTLHYTEPRICVSGKYILCFDRGGTDWCLIDSFRVLCSGTESGDIISGTVSDYGYISVSSERFGYNGCVTVYNKEGTPLSRWNSDTYLYDTSFLSKNELVIVSLMPEQEKVNTVFTVLDFRKEYGSNETPDSVTVNDLLPLAMAQKGDSDLEILSSSGTWLFDGKTVRQTHLYPDPSPGLYYQGKTATMLSYQESDGAWLVEACKTDGTVLFTARYPSLRSLCCYRDLFFVLTQDGLAVLNSSGDVLSEFPADSAEEVLASAEVSYLRFSGRLERLDLSFAE